MASSFLAPLQTFSVFVNNIPPNIHWRWLKQNFQHHGNVTDVFIPQKRSKSGRKYGFVRFSSLNDAKNAVEKLNGAWFLDYRLGVNFARFHERYAFWRRVDSQKEKLLQETFSKDAPPTVFQKSVSPSKATANPNLPRSFKQVLLNEGTLVESPFHYQAEKDSTQTKAKVCEGMVEESLIHNLERCMIGVARDYYEPNTLMENFKIQGVFDISVKKISGRQFLISFDEEETMRTMEELGWSWLKEWFVEVFHWSENMEYKFRTTWVTVYGVPLHAWNYSTFKNIAELWGDLLSMDGNTLKFNDFSRGAFLLMTDQVERIDEVINLECGKKFFKVRVSEVGFDVVSLFNNCCKSSRPTNLKSSPSSPWNNSEEEDSMDHKAISSDKDNSPQVRKPTDTSTCSPCMNISLSSSHSPSPNSKARLETPCDSTPDRVSEEIVPNFSDKGQKLQASFNEKANLNLNNKVNKRHALYSPVSPVGSKNVNIKEVEDEIENDDSCEGPARYKPLNLTTRKPFIQGRRKFKTLEDVEDSLLLKKGKKKLKIQKKKIMKKGNLKSSKAANESLSDGDFINRRRVLEKEARETWEVGKMMGFKTNLCDEQIINKLVMLAEQE